MPVALIAVGCVVEIPLETDAENDDQLLEQVTGNRDVQEALAHLVAGALDYRNESETRVGHKIKFTRIMLEPRELGWSTL